MKSLICPVGKKRVYHRVFVGAGDEPLESRLAKIQKEGLKATCHISGNALDLVLKERRCSLYGYPDANPIIHAFYEALDEGDYQEPPTLIEACVDETTKVYDMEHADEVAVWQALKRIDMYEITEPELVQQACKWKRSAIPLKSYKTGTYKYPEVLFKDIPPEHLRVVNLLEVPIDSEEQQKEMNSALRDSVDLRAYRGIEYWDQYVEDRAKEKRAMRLADEKMVEDIMRTGIMRDDVDCEPILG